MTTDQAQSIIALLIHLDGTVSTICELIQAATSLDGLMSGFAIGLTFSLGLGVYRAAKRSVEDVA